MSGNYRKVALILKQKFDVGCYYYFFKRGFWDPVTMHLCILFDTKCNCQIGMWGYQGSLVVKTL